jgi:hypothetical protein
VLSFLSGSPATAAVPATMFHLWQRLTPEARNSYDLTPVQPQYATWCFEELLDELCRQNRDVLPVMWYGRDRVRGAKQSLIEGVRRRSLPADE